MKCLHDGCYGTLKETPQKDGFTKGLYQCISCDCLFRVVLVKFDPECWKKQEKKWKKEKE